MYFTDTPELRKFEREMKQKPNFDKHNDDFSENEKVQHTDDREIEFDKKNNYGGK